jgi:hypothetical protein
MAMLIGLARRSYFMDACLGGVWRSYYTVYGSEFCWEESHSFRYPDLAVAFGSYLEIA